MHPKALLQAATELVRLGLAFSHPADAVLSSYVRQHHGKHAYGSRDRSVLADTFYHVLRHKLHYEHLAQTGSGELQRRLTILGFAQHLQEQNPGQMAATDFLKTALDESEIKWLDHCQSLAAQGMNQSHRFSLPAWLDTALRTQCADDTEFEQLAKGLLQTAPFDLRVNTISHQREDIQNELTQLGIISHPTPYSPWGLRLHHKSAIHQTALFKRGAVEVQNEGSQLLALLVEARRGESIVDFCAGAGGKTLALGAQMRSTGRLYAIDTGGHRLAALQPRLIRSKLSNVHPWHIAHEHDDRVKRLTGKIDRVLVDAPCTGLGTLRRNPDLKWRQNPQSVAQMQARQISILTAAAKLLKPGGRLVYATCSLLNEENQQVVSVFDRSHPHFKTVPALDILLRQKIPQAANLCQDGGRFLRLWPHQHNTDGFFAAAWQAA